MAVNQLESWRNNGVILLSLSSTARREAKADGDALRSRKADEHMFTLTDPCDSADDLYARIEAALFERGAQDENQRNDVRIVCEAAKYQAILVTNDGDSRSQPGGILGNRHKFRDFVDAKSADEAVAYVRLKIGERDAWNLRVHRELGEALPDWTGSD